MRLKSSIFVSAVIRQEQADGAFAMVLRKGAEDAGAVFLVHLKGECSDLYAPAPQVHFSQDKPEERLFELRVADGAAADISAALDREIRFDPDCWIVEIEKQAPLKSIQLAGPIGD